METWNENQFKMGYLKEKKRKWYQRKKLKNI